MSEEDQDRDEGSVSQGFALGIGLCVMQLAATFMTRSDRVEVLGLRFFGLIQLIYMVPLFLLLKKEQPSTATGLAIAAGVSALVNVTCAAGMR